LSGEPLMTNGVTSGFYGKMPCRGDFLSRGLPGDLIQRFDHWFQRGLLASQNKLGDQWAQSYFVAPIWHFYLPPGTANASAWLGVFIPSVDSVGRNFPCLIAAPLTAPLSDYTAFNQHAELLIDIEDMLLDCLEDGFDFEQFCSAVANIGIVNSADRSDEMREQTEPDLLADLYHHADKATLSIATACLWSSEGSEDVPAQLFASEGLPNEEIFHWYLTGIEAQRGHGND